MRHFLVVLGNTVQKLLDKVNWLVDPMWYDDLVQSSDNPVSNVIVFHDACHARKTIRLHIFLGVIMAKFRTETVPNGADPHTPATDRGYAWLVLLVCFMIDVLYSSSFMVGIFLVEFKHHFGVSATRVSWVSALQHSVGPIAGKCGW